MDKFYWGAATSAHQVEGKNLNDWTEFERDDGIEQSGNATDHYHRFREDFDIAQSISHNAHRFSIEWSRIEREKGTFNKKEIQHYRDILKALHERNIEPFVTLWHWTVPLWFRDIGGWLNKNSSDYFKNYVETVVREFPEVKFWIPLNEPNVYTTHAFLKGDWPPKQKGILNYFRANKNLILAHKKAYKIITQIQQDAKIGIAQNIVYFEPARNIFINKFLKFFPEYFWNHFVLSAVEQELDFIGINYYFHNRIDWGYNKNKNMVTSDMGWEIYPEGLYHVLLNTYTRYHKPLYITENGIADAYDDRRPKFIKDHVDSMQRAKHDGVDVRGYFYWSLLDNFEWAHGFAPRFGLVEVDYKTMQRRLRPSAKAYENIIDNS